MKIYIPKSDVERIPDIVMKSILRQSVGLEVIAVSSPALLTKREGEAVSRNLARAMMLNSQEPLLLMQDSDIVHLDTENVKKMVEFLHQNQDWGAVSLHRGKPARMIEHPHTCIACTLIRREVLICLEFKVDICPCIPFNRDIRAAGWRYGYLSTTPLVRELDRERIEL